MSSNQQEEIQGSNLWTCEPGTEDVYWREYETTRPKYGDSGFLDVIYDYHAGKEGAKFDVIHDVAAGAGHSAIEFAKRFRHVVLSDESGGSLEAAQRRMVGDGVSDGAAAAGQFIDGGKGEKVLADASYPGRCSFTVCAGERLADYHQANSADVVTIAESIPMMDERVTLNSFAHVLKPGGTVAIWFYGRPRFTEPEFRERCQPLYDAAMDRVFGRAMELGGEQAAATWAMATRGIASWLDYIDMKEGGTWKEVRRYRWNSGLADDPGFYSRTLPSLPVTWVSKADVDSEALINIEDRRFWTNEWDLDGVKKFCNYTFPNIDRFCNADEQIQTIFRQLGEAMGGDKAKRRYTIACSMILATKA